MKYNLTKKRQPISGKDSGAITGMDSDDFEIQFGGISSELMRSEFEQHYKKYYGNE